MDRTTTTPTRPRDILAANLQALMRERGKSFAQLRDASGVSNGTLDRIRRGVVATRVDELAPLARALGVHPWQLLVPRAVPSEQVGSP